MLARRNCGRAARIDGIVVAAALLLGAGGCASQGRLIQDVSARTIGCDPDAVVVTDVRRSGTRPQTWTAMCGDRAWACAVDSGRATCAAAELATR